MLLVAAVPGSLLFSIFLYISLYVPRDDWGRCCEKILDSTSSSLSPGILHPSFHLQLISSLVSLYLYLSTLTCSQPDCLVCFCQAIPHLFHCYCLITLFLTLFAC